jgi:methylase of polypeptide subunit release factors
MNQNLFKFLGQFANQLDYLNSLIVTAFLKINNITIVNNIFLKKYITTVENSDLYKLIFIIGNKFNLEKLISIFEFIVSPSDKIVTGAVYTPQYIRTYIIENILSNYRLNKNTKIADISCGCGGFLVTASEYIKLNSRKTYQYIFENYIWGLDIKDYSTERTKIMLSLLAAINGEDENFNFNIYTDNALTKEWDSKFDIIIGNPPYVHVRNMDNETKEHLTKWSVTKTGGTDLYLAFFQIGIENLKPNGILGYITVSSFIQSLNGKGLRTYFQNHQLDVKIIHFGDAQVFQGKSTYTCLCFITNIATSNISFTICSPNELEKITTESFDKLNYSDLSIEKGWLLKPAKTISVIEKIEKIGQPLGQKIAIRNGFATLKNNIYLLKANNEDANYYYFQKGNKEFIVEKEICREAIKANILRKDSDIETYKEYLIFPYKIENKINNVRLNIIPEDTLKLNYPYAYKYLLENQTILAARDKGNNSYEAWYAFGRRQALHLPGNKLLFPYICNKPIFIYSEAKDLLFYNGYALVADDSNKNDLLWLKKLLESCIFDYYIKKTSRYYSNNFFALAKNYIQNFGIPNLDKKEISKINTLQNKVLIDNFFLKIYNINKEDLA